MSTPTGGPANTKRASVIQILDLLETRMDWGASKQLLAETGLHVSRGWRETLEHAREDMHSEEIWEGAYKKLATAANWHTFVGNKHVSFFDLRRQNPEARGLLVGWAKERAVRDLQPVLKKRPFDLLDVPTLSGDLEAYKGVQPILLSAVLTDAKLYLQYFSARSYFLREHLDITRMSAEGAAIFQDYDELIGVRSRMVPCFDTVVVDTANDIAEIRVDFQPGMIEDRQVPTITHAMNEFNRATTKFIGQAAIGVGLMNLHPAIDPLYRDKRCGRVTALGFVARGAKSSSNNHGKIHRTKTDFRVDSFHVGGVQNVSKIDPYTLGITWPSSGGQGELTLELKGTVRAIYAGRLSDVTKAEITGCMNGSDYDFVVHQILSRLKRPSP